MAEHWVCVFESRAGGHARAVFGTSEQAKEFAERHARATTPPGVQLTWERVSESAVVLVTQLGSYVVAPTEEEAAPPPAPGGG
jgi:hypothetical protein